jgi:hypothetical protein
MGNARVVLRIASSAKSKLLNVFHVRLALNTMPRRINVNPFHF